MICPMLLNPGLKVCGNDTYNVRNADSITSSRDLVPTYLMHDATYAGNAGMQAVVSPCPHSIGVPAVACVKRDAVRTLCVSSANHYDPSRPDRAHGAPCGG